MALPNGRNGDKVSQGTGEYDMSLHLLQVRYAKLLPSLRMRFNPQWGAFFAARQACGTPRPEEAASV